MRRETSLYLDLLRFTAAATVFLSHLSWTRLSGGFLWPLQPYGHSAVVAFFVLSGYVIAYTAERKDPNLEAYALSRLSRLYSVVIPAIILTILLDSVGTFLDPSVYLVQRESYPVLRGLLAMTFLSHTWYWNASLLSNDAYWSMPYEFWYYVLFGAWFYLAGWMRVLVIAIGAAIAGPNILLMAPIWLMGVAVYRASQRLAISPTRASVLFMVTALGVVLVETADGREMFARATTDFLPPGFSPYDYLLGLFLSGNILAVSFISLPIGRFGGVIKALAGLTFSLYLFHLPLLHFFAAVLPRTLPARGPAMLVLTAGTIVILSLVTEKKKNLVKQGLEALLMATVAGEAMRPYTTEPASEKKAAESPAPVS